MVSKLKFKGDSGSSKKKRKTKSTDDADSAPRQQQQQQQSSTTDSEEIAGWTTAHSERDLYGPIMILLVSTTTVIDLTTPETIFGSAPAGFAELGEPMASCKKVITAAVDLTTPEAVSEILQDRPLRIKEANGFCKKKITITSNWIFPNPRVGLAAVRWSMVF